MKTSVKIQWILAAALILGLMSGTAVVLAQPEMPPRLDLAFLKDALQTAGAPALTSDQESSIKALIAEFRSAHQKPPENTAIQDARTAYENAILDGDSAAASTQAQAIVAAQTTDMVQREIDLASFAINVIAVLKTGSGQLAALTSGLGSSRLVRMILGMAGGPGGFGPRGGGPGFHRPMGL